MMYEESEKEEKVVSEEEEEARLEVHVGGMVKV